MNRVKSVVSVLILFVCTGCTTTRYERTVTVHRDANGAVTSVVEVEHATQAGSRKKLPNWYMYDKGAGQAKQ